VTLFLPVLVFTRALIGSWTLFRAVLTCEFLRVPLPT